MTLDNQPFPISIYLIQGALWQFSWCRAIKRLVSFQVPACSSMSGDWSWFCDCVNVRFKNGNETTGAKSFDGGTRAGGGGNGRFPLFVYHCSFSCFLQLNRIWNWGRGFYWHGRGGIVSLDVASNAIRSQYNRIPGRPAMICWNKTVEIGASGWYTLRQFPFLFVSV